MDLIVAVDQNWAIGKDGEQLLYLSQDLKRFKALTLGHAVILGRRTLSTFPGGRPLKGRRNLILSTTPGFAPEGSEVSLGVGGGVRTPGGERSTLPVCDLPAQAGGVTHGP